VSYTDFPVMQSNGYAAPDVTDQAEREACLLLEDLNCAELVRLAFPLIEASLVGEAGIHSRRVLAVILGLVRARHAAA
jgi:hypothetical protein